MAANPQICKYICKDAQLFAIFPTVKKAIWDVDARDELQKGPDAWQHARTSFLARNPL
jgi:hypothetical protein